MLAQYCLRAELVGHSKDVRCVLSVDGVAGNKSESVILSGSRDSAAKIWLEDSESHVYDLAHSLADHKNFVSALAHMDPNEEHAVGIIFTASLDKSIRAYAAESPPRFLYQLLGHEKAVSGLTIDARRGFLVSSSWDNTARIWSGRDCIATLSGHLAAVWDVAVVPPHASQVEETQHHGTSLPRILTASADHTVKLWNGTAEQRTFVGHSDAVRGLAVLSAMEFLSCSNDGSVRRWLAESGSCVAVYTGHEDNVYSIALSKSGDQFVTGSEDRTVRVWSTNRIKDTEAKQVLILPAQSVWSVGLLPNGDIVTGSSDGFVRIFTRHEALVTSSLALSTYDAEVAAFGQAIEASDEIGGIKIGDMPGVESMQPPATKFNLTAGVFSSVPGADPIRPRTELLPLPDYITFTSVKAEEVKAKLRENNEKVPANRKLTDTDLAALESLLDARKQTTITEEHCGALNYALKWSGEFLVPVLDTFRMALLLPAINEHFFGAAGGAGREALLEMCGLLRTGDGKAPPAPAIVILVCRALANAFAHAAGRQAVLRCVEELLPFVLASLSTPKPAAQVAAAATLANLALLLHQAPREAATASVKQSFLVQAIGHLISTPDYCCSIDQDALLEILQAFATIIWGDEVFIPVARSLKLGELLVRIKDAVEEEKVKDLARTVELMVKELATSVFGYNQVRYKNGYDVSAKLSAIRLKGMKSVQILSDFDATMTKFGPGNQATYEIAVAAVGAKRPDLADELKQLAARYRPFEFAPDLSNNQKAAAMVEWYTQQNAIIVDAGISFEDLKLFVGDSNIRLRDKCAQFFAALEASDVPLIIFSAGIGDVIDIFLKLRLGQISPNIHVIANFTDLDEKGTVIGFKRPLIHTFNKNSLAIPEELPEYFERLRGRPNVLVLGDTIGDSSMDIGLYEPESSVILKIGFLNKDPEALLQSYLDVFDVVVLEDQSFDVVMAIWEEISRA